MKRSDRLSPLIAIAAAALTSAALTLAGNASPATAPSSAPIVWQAERPVIPGAKSLIALPDGRLLCSATRHEDGKTILRVFESRDDGRTFHSLPNIVDADDSPGVDLGDAAMLVTRDGAIWISYRHNVRKGDELSYALKVARSSDGGKTWARSTVASSFGVRGQASRGLWASCLFERSDGVVQCYYDDEDVAFRGGKPQHQWISMKTWDAQREAWANPVVVSRAHDPAKLSRDGMMSVVETSPNKLLVVFESVATERPHENVIRSVTSDDGGVTWSWTKSERGIVYTAPKKPHMAFAPWTASLGGDRLICVFVTDEDRAVADVSGTPPHRMNADVKYIVSNDRGRTWSASAPIAADSHRYYLPGVAVRTVNGKTEVFVSYLDFGDGTCRLARGTISSH